VITDALKMDGHQVTVAGNGREAIALWEKGAYNLVLMDVQMPEMSGLEATEAIRRREAERGGHTVIIAISAGAMKEDREKCLQAGMDDYISKPVDMKELLRKLGNKEKAGETGDRHGFSDDPIAAIFNLNSMPGLKNNRDALEQYARSFMKDINGEMDAMERAIREGDHEQIGKSAHTVKGMSGHLKSDQIMRIAGEIERMGAENDLKA
ncbi:MAG: response regulator, partial [Planctomycetes bacterium]|nr:response regulator [Planctomycetota bacterium]